MIETVYVLFSPVEGRPADVNIFNAASGFEQRGLDTVPVVWKDVLAGKVDISPARPLLGGVGAVHEALRLSGAIVPLPIDYPEALEPLLGRSVRKGTMREVRATVGENDVAEHPVFVKPWEHTKIFTGHVVHKYRDLIKTASCSPDMDVWISETVRFVSEYRYFVHQGRVVHVGFYKGDPLVAPDTEVVRSMIGTYMKAGTPVSWCLDVGVTDEGHTLLVEVNDGFAFGCYGMPAQMHSIMFEDRWREMVGLPLLPAWL